MFVKEIAPKIHAFVGGMKGGQEAAFLLEDDAGDLTLIDTLFDTDARHILDRVESIGKIPADLKHIILSHGHRAHLGGLRVLKELSGATVHAHDYEADIISGDRTAQPVTPIPMKPRSAYWRVFHLQFGASLGLGAHPPCPVDHLLEHGDRVGPLHVLHTPGHAVGHLAFWWPEREVLFAGDAIVTYPTFAPGWPAFTLNPRQHHESLRELASLNPQLIAVGHGKPVTEDAARLAHSLTWASLP